MVSRNIVKIDKEKCNGCGECVNSCAEGAIEIIDGTATVISEIYCDGLGACIGHCPEDAITIEKRESLEFDEEATKKHLAKQKSGTNRGVICPGLAEKQFRGSGGLADDEASSGVSSQLSHWPVQLRLVQANAAFLAEADLLLVADCVPFAMPDFHSRFLKDHTVAVGCPKLDDANFYVEKLAEILKVSNINSLTVVHMEVPCCSGLTHIATEAIANAGFKRAFEDITIDLRGNVISSETL